MFEFKFNYRLIYSTFDLIGINNIDMEYIKVYNASHSEVIVMRIRWANRLRELWLLWSVSYRCHVNGGEFI